MHRYRKIDALLSPGVKRRLSGVSKRVVDRLLRVHGPRDYEALVGGELVKAFGSISPDQRDLLAFMVLSDTRSHFDSMAEMGDLRSLELQMIMQRREKAVQTLSNLLKRIADTADSLVRNIK